MNAPAHDAGKDLARVKESTSKFYADIPDSSRLSAEQLQDLNEILNLAGYLLAKYEDRKDFYAIMEEFVEIIKRTASSIEKVDADVEEMLISAESSVASLREAYDRMSQGGVQDAQGA